MNVNADFWHEREREWIIFTNALISCVIIRSSRLSMQPWAKSLIYQSKHSQILANVFTQIFVQFIRKGLLNSIQTEIITKCTVSICHSVIHCKPRPRKRRKATPSKYQLFRDFPDLAGKSGEIPINMASDICLGFA